MANELLVSIKIGASLSGAFKTAFASVKGTLAQLGQVGDELKNKHSRLGEVMARGLKPIRQLQHAMPRADGYLGVRLPGLLPHDCGRW